MTDSLYLGLDVGGTKCAVLVGNSQGQSVRSALRWPTRVERGPDAIINQLTRDAQTLSTDLPGRIAAVGVSIGGPLDGKNGVVLSPPNLPGWDELPLRAMLEGKLQLPVNVMHDAAACALAEQRWGLARGRSRVAYLTCGTGFGAGFVFDGQVYHGAHGLNAEIGHVRIRDDGPEAFGKVGSAEAWCSARGLSRLAAWKNPQRWGISAPSPQEVAQLWRAGDADANLVVNLNASAVGDVAALLADTLQLDCILLGSLARYLGDPWVDLVRLRFREQVLPALRSTCHITPCGLGDRLQDCSALAAAMVPGT